MGDSCIMWCPNLWLVIIFCWRTSAENISVERSCRKKIFLQKAKLAKERKACWRKSAEGRFFVETFFWRKILQQDDVSTSHIQGLFCRNSPGKYIFLQQILLQKILQWKSYCRKYFWWSHCRKYFCAQHRQREDCLHLDATPATLSLMTLALCNQKQWRC